MKVDWGFWLVVGLFIFVFLILFYIIFVKIDSDGAKCTLEPLVYKVQQLEKKNLHPVQCSCILFSPNPSPILYANNETVWFEDIDSNNENSRWFNQEEVEGILGDLEFIE